jgi:hypothetical protein
MCAGRTQARGTRPLSRAEAARAGLVLTALFYGFFVCLWIATVAGPRVAAIVGSSAR